jgi:ABC-type uncharacterized transport system ATPase subunit
VLPVESAASEIPAIALSGITKRFGPVLANDHVDLRVAKGSIHGIVGENGAGKSTLMSILYGYYQADEGSILVDGKRVTIRSSADAIHHGIGMVHQHFMQVEPFTVLENVLLGAEGGALLAHGEQAMRGLLAALAKTYGLGLDPDARAENLSVGEQQRLEILKSLCRKADVLILDEPTGVLTPHEADQLFDVLRLLKDQGKSVLLITHKLREIMAITDQVSVMRGGKMVAHRRTAETSAEELGELMVGRKIAARVHRGPASPGAVALEAKDLRVKDATGIERVKGVSLSVRAGEIVGLAGVAGNGQSELLQALARLVPVAGGSIVSGRLGLVPEDRHRDGMIGAFAARDNILLGEEMKPAFRRLKLFTDWKAVDARTMDLMRSYDVRPTNPHLPMIAFSGGNQQKLVMAREIERDPDILLVGQPTRGVDIGAIEFIHKRLIAMRDAGKAILLVSVELEEILALSDRIHVMFDGHLSGPIAASDADERRLGLLMAGIAEEHAA